MGYLARWFGPYEPMPGRCQAVQGHSYEKKAAVANINDVQFNEMLNALTTVNNQNDLEKQVIGPHGDTIANHGYSNIYPANIDDVDGILQSPVKEYYVYSVFAEIKQFLEGMKCIGGFGDTVLDNPHSLQKLLCHTPSKFTSHKFRSLYTLQYSEGTNDRLAEECTVHSLELFIQDIQEGGGGQSFSPRYTHLCYWRR